MTDHEHAHKVRGFFRSPVLSLVVGIIALAFAMGALQVLRSNAETQQLREELAAARDELATRDLRLDCILELQSDVYKADDAWSVAFTDLVVGLSIRGDIPSLVAQLDVANGEKRAAVEAYDQQTGC
jgi:hypothetical protein